MTPTGLRVERLRSHRLTAPAPTVAEAAAHMLAVQAQEFWGGRWALASRTRGAPTIADVDRLFDDGTLVRSWPLRGTLHILPARDLAWMLTVTADRQRRAAAPRWRELGIDQEVLAVAERAVRGALRGGGALARTDMFAVLERVGIDPAAQRGSHILHELSVRAVVCQGPVVPRTGGMSREQHFVLAEEHIAQSATPPDPVAEMFVRYVTGHGPATAADFAWWSGLTLTAARVAAASAAQRLREVDDGVYASPEPPRRRATASVLALASFDEYYLSYVDRSVVGDAAQLRAVGPGSNGMVRPILVRDGVIVGTWRASTALGRHIERPDVELLADVPQDEVDAALRRYAAFAAG